MNWVTDAVPGISCLAVLVESRSEPAAGAGRLGSGLCSGQAPILDSDQGCAESGLLRSHSGQQPQPPGAPMAGVHGRRRLWPTGAVSSRDGLMLL